MYTIPIEIPKGYEANLVNGVIKITAAKKKGPVTERILTIDDVLADNSLTRDQFDKQCAGLEQDEIAYRIIKLLAKSLNEGWEPDWSNSGEYKYYPWFEMRGSSGFLFSGYDYWATASGVGSRLCFKSRELAEHAGRNFTGVYEELMTIK